MHEVQQRLKIGNERQDDRERGSEHSAHILEGQNEMFPSESDVSRCQAKLKESSVCYAISQLQEAESYDGCCHQVRLDAYCTIQPA